MRFMLVLSTSSTVAMVPYKVAAENLSLYLIFFLLAQRFLFFLVTLLQPAGGSRSQKWTYIVTTHICTTIAYAKYAKQFFFSPSIYAAFSPVTLPFLYYQTNFVGCATSLCDVKCVVYLSSAV